MQYRIFSVVLRSTAIAILALSLGCGEETTPTATPAGPTSLIFHETPGGSAVDSSGWLASCAGTACTTHRDPYDMAAVSISLIECRNAASAPVACSSAYQSVQAVHDLFKTAGPANTPLVVGGQEYFRTKTASNVTDVETANNSDLAGDAYVLDPIPQTASGKAGAMRITLAYVESFYPRPSFTPGTNTIVNAFGEYLFDPQGGGMNYRICLAPTSATPVVGAGGVSPLFCGNAEAVRGDLLVDRDGDGAFGFLETVSVVQPFGVPVYKESPSRPAFYIYNIGPIAAGTAGTPANWVNGYYSRIIAFNSVVDLPMRGNIGIEISHNPDNTFSWTDVVPDQKYVGEDDGMFDFTWGVDIVTVTKDVF